MTTSEKLATETAIFAVSGPHSVRKWRSGFPERPRFPGTMSSPAAVPVTPGPSFSPPTQTGRLPRNGGPPAAMTRNRLAMFHRPIIAIYYSCCYQAASAEAGEPEWTNLTATVSEDGGGRRLRFAHPSICCIRHLCDNCALRCTFSLVDQHWYCFFSPAKWSLVLAVFRGEWRAVSLKWRATLAHSLVCSFSKTRAFKSRALLTAR